MLNTFEKDLRERLNKRWFSPTPVGLGIDAIATATAFWPHELPLVYQRFLQVCGQDAGDLFFEYRWRVTELKTMNERLLNYAEDSAVTPPDSVFAFLDYIGDYFWCFCAGEADPTVLLFDHCQFTEINYQLSDFLLKWEQYETPRG